MSDETRPRGSRFAGLLVYLIIGAAACGVIGWYVSVNRHGPVLDTSGFDIAAAPASRPTAAAPGAAPIPSSVGMVKPGMLSKEIDKGGAAKPPDAAPAPAPAAPPAADADDPESRRRQADLSLTEAARKHEQRVREFTKGMETRYPSLTKYARDWNAAPDLRALKDQYWKDRDPVRFAYGLARSPSFPGLVKKYADDPGIHAFITEGIKNAPAELLGVAGQVFQNDTGIKDLVVGVTQTLGLPENMTSALGPAAPGAPAPGAKGAADVMNSPEIQKALQNQPPAVALPDSSAKPPEQP